MWSDGERSSNRGRNRCGRSRPGPKERRGQNEQYVKLYGVLKDRSGALPEWAAILAMSLWVLSHSLIPGTGFAQRPHRLRVVQGLGHFQGRIPVLVLRLDSCPGFD